MVDSYRGESQGDDRHQKTVANPSDNNPADLFDLLAQIGAPVDQPDPALPMWQQFEAFHQAHPLVYRALRLVAIQRVNKAGPGNTGFPAIWEHARWELGLRTAGDTWLLNNNFRSYYSRLLMLQEPELAGAWETRRAPDADAWIARKAAEQAGERAA